MSDDRAEQLVLAIITGETDTVAALPLAAAPELANHRLARNGRSMLHYATDWPGHYPGVATSIALLIGAGADPDVTVSSDSPGVAETPLHWAASSDDVDAVRALLDGGATVDALGGIFDGCTPYVEATVFQTYGAAQLLLDRGAANWLPGAAALGHAESVQQFFDADGNLRVDVGRLLHDDVPPNAPVFLDRAFQFACRAGHLEIARFLLERGADPAAISPADTSARDMAAANGHDDVTRWLDEVQTGP